MIRAGGPVPTFSSNVLRQSYQELQDIQGEPHTSGSFMITMEKCERNAMSNDSCSITAFDE